VPGLVTQDAGAVLLIRGALAGSVQKRLYNVRCRWPTTV